MLLLTEQGLDVSSVCATIARIQRIAVDIGDGAGRLTGGFEVRRHGDYR